MPTQPVSAPARNWNPGTIEPAQLAPAAVATTPVQTYTSAGRSATRSMDADQGLPPNARAGECFARVYQPPVYETTQESILVSDESERMEIIQAKYEWVEKEVLVREASERLEVIPAQYNTVTERVEVKPASTKVEEVPAQYKTVTEQVLVKAGHTAWKKGRGPTQRLDGATGEIMCLVEVPPEYKTVTRQVLVSSPTTRQIEVPAEYETITKTVMTQPPTTKTIVIPAEYEKIRVREMVSPESKRSIPIPARYETVEKQVLKTGGKTIWQRVLCETNLTNPVISSIQTALLAKGYDPGPINGQMGEFTVKAISDYQRDQNLSVGGLTIETADHLGVAY